MTTNYADFRWIRKKLVFYCSCLVFLYGGKCDTASLSQLWLKDRWRHQSSAKQHFTELEWKKGTLLQLPLNSFHTSLRESLTEKKTNVFFGEFLASCLLLNFDSLEFFCFCWLSASLGNSRKEKPQWGMAICHDQFGVRGGRKRWRHPVKESQKLRRKWKKKKKKKHHFFLLIRKY